MTQSSNSGMEPQSYAPKPWLIIRWLLEQRNDWARRVTECEDGRDALRQIAQPPPESVPRPLWAAYYRAIAARALGEEAPHLGIPEVLQ